MLIRGELIWIGLLLMSTRYYNHGNIITKFVFRPFRDVRHMNEVMIERHNSRVKNNDVVYHLGDFKLSTQELTVYDIIQRLNGRHVFIRGNHDKNNGLSSTLEYAVIKSYGHQILLIHKPEKAIELLDKLNLNLAFVGHVHELWKFQIIENKTLINVGVDQWDFYPVDIKQIFKAIDIKRG